MVDNRVAFEEVIQRSFAKKALDNLAGSHQRNYAVQAAQIIDSILEGRYWNWRDRPDASIYQGFQRELRDRVKRQQNNHAWSNSDIFAWLEGAVAANKKQAVFKMLDRLEKMLPGEIKHSEYLEKRYGEEPSWYGAQGVQMVLEAAAGSPLADAELFSQLLDRFEFGGWLPGLDDAALLPYAKAVVGGVHKWGTRQGHMQVHGGGPHAAAKLKVLIEHGLDIVAHARELFEAALGDVMPMGIYKDMECVGKVDGFFNMDAVSVQALFSVKAPPEALASSKLWPLVVKWAHPDFSSGGDAKARQIVHDFLRAGGDGEGIPPEITATFL